MVLRPCRVAFHAGPGGHGTDPRGTERSAGARCSDADCPFTNRVANRDGSRAGLANFTQLHLSHGLGLLDSLIASIAAGLSAELCTFNDKHYRAVPGLIIVQRYSRPI